MAEEAAKGEKEAPQKASLARVGLNPGILILGVALLFIASMGSAFLAVTFLGRSSATPKASAPATEEAKKASQFGPAQEIGSFTVNLADEGERLYLKAGVAVEVSNAEAGAELTSRDPQVKDIVLSVLSSRTMAEVAKPEGREAVKKEIRDRINRLLTKGKVRNVFFTEFVFQ
ncbi:MAG: flagellar basal body-associated FliL family protein [Bacillota bacterium]|nr:flagellar basal body-associated FliL family protein [Bacillota bacterium]